MLAPWLEDPRLAELAGQMSDAAGLDLATLGSTADADQIKDTAITQPLVVAATLLASTALAEHTAVPDDAPTAGHSVGELAAAAVAGVLDPMTAVRLAARRGQAMAACCAETATSMAAVLGGDPEQVLADLETRGLVGANVNGGGQIVAAGRVEQLADLPDDPPGGATRVIPLSVAGAFHTSYMAGAETALTEAVAGVTPADPTRPLLTNSDGSVVVSGERYLGLLVRQLTRPVRWDRCMGTLASLGVTGVIEFPPAGALVGLVKRELRGTATLALKTPDDLDKAAAFIADHAGATAPGAAAAPPTDPTAKAPTS